MGRALRLGYDPSSSAVFVTFELSAGSTCFVQVAALVYSEPSHGGRPVSACGNVMDRSLPTVGHGRKPLGFWFTCGL